MGGSRRATKVAVTSWMCCSVRALLRGMAFCEGLNALHHIASQAFNKLTMSFSQRASAYDNRADDQLSGSELR